MNPNLKNEIEIELEYMESVLNESISLYNQIGENEPDIIQKTALSAFASQFYNGVENILKRIHRNNNIELPTGDNWHIQLLQRFSKNVNFNIPIKFEEKLYSSLNDIRRFRHYFFHGYSKNIDWLILKESILELPEIFNSFKATIYSYIDSSG